MMPNRRNLARAMGGALLMSVAIAPASAQAPQPPVPQAPASQAPAAPAPAVPPPAARPPAAPTPPTQPTPAQAPVPQTPASQAPAAQPQLPPPAASAPAAPAPASLIDTIRARGALLCGVNPGLAGFAAADAQGNWSGFDVDYCRAIAIAIFGTAQERVRFIPTTAQTRFTALQSGDVDVLVRNTSWTFTRDAVLGFDFGPITFHDGQGFMLKGALGVQNARQLAGATVCVQSGTSAEQTLTEWARASRINLRPVIIERLDEIIAAYGGNRCDAFTTDISALAAIRAVLPNPADHVILPDVLSKEPLAPVFRQGHPRFADLVRWVHFGLIAAEELGVTAAQARQMAEGDPRPDVQRLLGRTGDFGRALGVDNAWMLNVVATLGHYGEIYERNLAPIGLQRGRNALWTQPGGLQYAPPLR
jgi:general L-amino acid transport system substrate-binding protein